MWLACAAAAVAIAMMIVSRRRRRRRLRSRGRPTPADLWVQKHRRTCAAQARLAGTYAFGRGTVRLCPGFEESYYSTVGDPITHFYVICNACGESCEGSYAEEER